MGQKLVSDSLIKKRPDLAKEWHQTKNGKLTPNDVSYNSKSEVWWMLPHNDPETGKHFDFEWKAKIYDRAVKDIRKCPYLSKTNTKVWRGFNDLASKCPELIKEWHTTKNGDLKPTDVTVGSNKKVWWYLQYDDPKTGKHFDFEWKMSIRERAVVGHGCPFLSGQRIYIGFNDLATTHPNLVKEWHPTKNGNLSPTEVSSGMNKKIWWLQPYDDPRTGKHFNFEWKARINSRVDGNGCPYLSSTHQRVLVGFNDLATTHPTIAQQWHATKNGDLNPTEVTSGFSKKVWWQLSHYDVNTGKWFNFEWQDTVNHRVQGRGCPYLSNTRIYIGFNDLLTTHPCIAAEWHPTKNANLKPSDITAGSNKKVWWLLSYDDPKTGHHDFEWLATINTRTRGHGCPYLSNSAVWPGFNDLATAFPHISKEWNYQKNGNLKPTDVTAYTDKKVWWKTEYEGKIYEWYMSINARTKQNQGCPELSSSKLEKTVGVILKNNDIKFNKEKKYDNLRTESGNQCKYDFYLKLQNMLIECDGIQHFSVIEHFGGESEFKQRIANDNKKNRYAIDNGILLLRIPYIYDPIKDKEKIEALIIEFITTKTVPEEISEFYLKYKFSNYINCITK